MQPYENEPIRFCKAFDQNPNGYFYTPHAHLLNLCTLQIDNDG